MLKSHVRVCVHGFFDIGSCEAWVDGISFSGHSKAWNRFGPKITK